MEEIVVRGYPKYK